MALAQRFIQDALADMQRAMNVFDQPFFNRRVHNALTDDINFDSISPSFFGMNLLRNKAYPATDLKETADSYELHAEIPGYDKKDIKVEMLDSRTLVLSGSREKDKQAKNNVQVDSEETKHTKDSKDDSDKLKQQDHKKNPQEVFKKDSEQRDIAAEEETASTEWWINERVHGTFKRTFTFSHPVEQDKVKASYENGILKVIVPKTSKGPSRLIDID